MHRIPLPAGPHPVLAFQGRSETLSGLAHLFLGGLHERRDALAEARTHLRRSVEITPDAVRLRKRVLSGQGRSVRRELASKRPGATTERPGEGD